MPVIVLTLMILLGRPVTGALDPAADWCESRVRCTCPAGDQGVAGPPGDEAFEEMRAL